MRRNRPHSVYEKYYNVPVKTQGWKVFYFNENGILSKDSLIHAADHQILKNINYNSWIRNMPGEERIAYINEHKKLKGIAGSFEIEYLNKILKTDAEKDFGLILNGRVYSRTVIKLKEGDTFEDFLNMLRAEVKKEEQHRKILMEAPVYSFILSIHISIERATGNTNLDTFDFVRVTALTPSYRTDTKAFAQKNLPKIIELMIEKLNTSKKFQRYGVPLNYLKMSNITLTQSKEIQVLFELKGEISDEDLRIEGDSAEET